MKSRRRIAFLEAQDHANNERLQQGFTTGGMGFGGQFARQQSHTAQCPLWVKSGHRRTSNQCPHPQKRTLELSCGMSALCQKRTSDTYSITSSAIAMTPGGIVSPSALAVLRLITSSNVVGWIIGRSAGLAPLRILPIYTPTCWYAAARLGP